MSKTYDPQYSTKVNFNIPALLLMVNLQDIDKLNHWINNAEPHKKMAKAALINCINLNWVDGIQALWDSQWLNNKSFLLDAWVALIDYSYHNKALEKSCSEVWLFTKTFNESNLTASEFNTLSIELLDKSVSVLSTHYWKIFFSNNLKLTGKKSETLFWNLVYYSTHNKQDNEEKEIPITDEFFYQACIDDVLKCGIQIEVSLIMTVLMKSDLKLFRQIFWKIMCSHIIMDAKNLMLLACFISMYYKLIIVHYQNKALSDAKEELAMILSSLIKWGIPEKVTFTKRDILSESFNPIFLNGMGYISLTALHDFKYKSINAYASHLPEFKYRETNAVDVDLYLGDIWLTEPKYQEGHIYVYKPISDAEQIKFRREITKFFK